MRRLTTCVLIASMTSLILAGCGDASAPAATDTAAETPPPATAPASRPAEPAARPARDDSGLTLQTAGEEPRAVVRYSIRPGAEIRRQLTTAMRRDQSHDESNLKEVFPLMNLTLRSVTATDSSDDEIRSTYIFTEHSVEENPALPEQHVDIVRGMLSQAVGITRVARMAPNGSVIEQTLNTQGLSREMRRHVEGLIVAANTMTPVFPEQPIGLNAQWLVKQTVQEGDHKINQTTSYRLVGRDGDTVTLTYQVFQTADPQKLEQLEGTVNQTMLLNYSGQGSGNIVIDLDELLPARADVSLTVESTISLGQGRSNKVKRQVVNKIGPVETTG